MIKTTRLAFQPSLQRNKKYFWLLTLLFFASCASLKPSARLDQHKMISFFQGQRSQINSMRGRAWIKAKIKGQTISLAAVIAFERFGELQNQLHFRMDLLDPLGIPHAVFAMKTEGPKNQVQAVWYHLDQDEKKRIQDSWYGLELEQLADIMLGLSFFPKEGVVKSISDETLASNTLKIQASNRAFQYEVVFIDPGARMALKNVLGDSAHGRFQADYAKYGDLKDYYLPNEVKIKAWESKDLAEPNNPTLELELAWRERKWNEAIEAKVFDSIKY